MRLDVAGKPPHPVAATASLVVAVRITDILQYAPTIPVISALGAGLGAVTVGSNGTNTNSGTALIFTNQTGGTPADDKASVVLAEGFASAWRTTTQVNTQGLDSPTMNGTLIRLTIGGLPGGVTATLTIPGTGGVANAIPGDTGAIFISTGNSTATVDSSTSTSNIEYVKFVSANLAALENLEVDIACAPTAALAPGSITLTASLAPIGNALSGGAPTQTTPSSAGGCIRQLCVVRGASDVGSNVAPLCLRIRPY